MLCVLWSVWFIDVCGGMDIAWGDLKIECRSKGDSTTLCTQVFMLLGSSMRYLQ